MAGQMKRRDCPHCGQTLPVNMYQRHVDTCLYDPAVWERTAEALRSKRFPGYIIGLEEYTSRSQQKRNALPSWRTLYKFVGGTWPDVAAEFGLLWQKRKDEPDVFADELYRIVVDGRLSMAPVLDDWPLAARRGFRVVGKWDVVAKRWLAAYAQEVFLLR